MSIKAKKRIIIVLSVILVLFSGVALGANLYIDSILNKMNQKDEYDGKDVNANDLDGNVVNIALLGIDQDDSGGDTRRTDVIKIISLDMDHDVVKISSIQRDNLMYIPTQDKYDKLNHAYQYDGMQGTLSALNHNLDLDITKYLAFNFDSVTTVIDILGGVDIELSAAEAAQAGVNGAGVQHLNGTQALAYSRIRNLDSDYGRMQRQNNVINAVLSSMSGKSPLDMLDIIIQVMPHIETNISNNSIKSYLMSMVSFDLGNTQQYQFPSGGYDDILASLALYGYGPQYVLKDFSGCVKGLHDYIYEGNYKVSNKVKKVTQEMLDFVK